MIWSAVTNLWQPFLVLPCTPWEGLSRLPHFGRGYVRAWMKANSRVMTAVAGYIVGEAFGRWSGVLSQIWNCDNPSWHCRARSGGRISASIGRMRSTKTSNDSCGPCGRLASCCKPFRGVCAEVWRKRWLRPSHGAPCFGSISSMPVTW